MVEARLMRSREDNVITGVAGGLAHYLDVDARWVRAGFVLLGLTAGIGVGIYVIMSLIVPDDSEIAQEEGGGLWDAAELRTIRNLKRDHAIAIAAVLLVVGVTLTVWQL